MMVAAKPNALIGFIRLEVLIDRDKVFNIVNTLPASPFFSMGYYPYI